MPDVGVLNLQIRDDSAQSTGGLEKLVGLLERMKEASSGVKLAPVATGINKIKEAISKIGQGEIDQLSQLADILNRIQGAAQGVNGIKISFGKAKQEADRIRESMEAARGGTGNGAGNGTELAGNFVNISAGIQSARNEFAALYGEVEKFNGLVENTAWQFGDMGKKIAQVVALWNQMRMAMSLPAGGNAGLLSGAITGEGSISDPNEIIQYASSLEQVRDGAVQVQEAAAEMEQVRDGTVQAQEAAAEMAQSVHEASTETETLGESARGTKEQLEYEAEFLRRCAEMADKYKASEEANKEVNARFGRMMQPLSLEETDNMASYVTELTKMEAELEKASAAYNKFVNTLGAGDVKTINAALKLNKIREAIDKYREAEERASTPKRSVGDTNAAAAQVTQYDQLIAKLHEAREAYNALMNDPSATASKQMGGAMAIHKAEADINAYNALQEKLQTVRPEVQQFAQEQLNAGVSAATLTKQLFGLDGELKRKKGDLSAVSNETKSLVQRFNELVGGASGLGGAMKKMFPTLTGMLSRFKQLAKYRMLRAVITQITKGFREGLENYYRYSEAVGGSFAPAMDSAASSLAQMKNSIGAAVAPALQALIPVLNSVVNWVISGVNWLNQFFALLNGQKTWSKAMPQTTKAFDDQSKKAKKAGAAIKDLLADWDELNIIQSNTSGGGGTGGTTPATDYIKMFEEVKTFDKSVGDFIDRIRNTFGDIKELVALVGTAILGWKFSRAFNNVLGKIGQLAAGISISIIGVKLAYGGAYSAGQKGFFDTTDLVQTIGGIFAAGIGGELVGTAVFGPGVGFAVGITVGIVAALVGYIEGMKDTEDALKWGSNSLTPEQVQDYVKKQFTFDIDARINLLDAMIVGQEDAQRALNEKVTAFNESLSKVTISVDDGPQGIEKAADDAMALIDQINSNIAQSEKNIEVLAKIVPLTNQDGEDETDSILAGLKIADKGLTDYFTDMGKEIAYWIDLGQKTEWKNNEAEMAMELMRHQQNIIDQANKSKSKREFEVATEVSLSTMTRDSAKAVYDEEIKRIEEYKQKILEATQNEMVNALWYADLADAAGLKDESGNPLGDYYRTYAESLKKQIEDGTIYNELNDSVKKQKEAWIEALQKIYGNDKDTGLALTLFTRGLFTPDKLQQAENTLLKEFGDYSSSNILNSEFYNTLMAKWASVGGNATEDIANYISGILSSGFGKVDPQNIIGSTTKAWGFSLINILNDDMRTEMVRALYMSSGQDTEATENVLRLLGLDDETIKRTVSAVKAQQSDEVDKIKEAYENGEELKDDMEDETDRVSEGMPTVGLPVGVHPEAYIEPGEENIDIDTGSGTGAGIGLPIDLQFDSDKSWIGNIAEQLGFELVNGQYVLKAYIKYITDDQPGNTPNMDEETRNPIPGGAQLWTVEKSGVTPGATWTPGGANGGTMTVLAEVDNSEQESNVANGVTRGMTGVENLLDSIARTVVGILNKPVPTAGYPTANEGRRNAQAAREYGLVTGYTS